MSEELTERLNGGEPFETRVLAELAVINSRLTSMDGQLTSVEGRLASVEGRLVTVESGLASVDERLTSLDEKVDARLRETRPIWETVLSRLDVIDSKLGVLAYDLLHMRGEVDLLKKRSPPAA